MPRDLLFLDVETTGLDVDRHDIDTASPEALAINGYSPEAWESACKLRVALDWLWPMLREAVPAGHGVGFDLAFLERAARDVGLGALPCDYHRLDTASLAWLFTQSGECERVSLQPVCDALGLPRARAHRALDDALASLSVARAARERWCAAPGAADMERIAELALTLGSYEALGLWAVRNNGISDATIGAACVAGFVEAFEHPEDPRFPFYRLTERGRRFAKSFGSPVRLGFDGSERVELVLEEREEGEEDDAA
jgi:DNA polymerase-3 subunit epsilon